MGSEEAEQVAHLEKKRERAWLFRVLSSMRPVRPTPARAHLLAAKHASFIAGFAKVGGGRRERARRKKRSEGIGFQKRKGMGRRRETKK